MEFKDILKTRRAELNLTLEDIARHVGVSSATVSRWEKGEIENVRRDKIANLSEVLQVSPGHLMGWTEFTANSVPPEKIEDDVSIQILNRGAKNMTPEQREKLLNMAKMMFEKEFDGL